MTIQQEVLKLLETSARTRDQLVRASGKSMGRISTALFRLRTQGKIYCIGGVWILGKEKQDG